MTTFWHSPLTRLAIEIIVNMTVFTPMSQQEGEEMNIKKWMSLVLAAALMSTMCVASAATFTPGEYEATAQGFGGAIEVKLTVDEEAITAIEINGASETPTLGGAAIEQFVEAYVGTADAEAVDSVAGATITSDAVKAAVANALAQAKGEAVEAAEMCIRDRRTGRPDHCER